jgi:hypothetical protein
MIEEQETTVARRRRFAFRSSETAEIEARTRAPSESGE